MNTLNPALLDLLVCPNCTGALLEINAHLDCTQCASKFEIADGIPLLYPASMDIAHLREEENLATMMKSRRVTPKEAFSTKQWAMSKSEFWSIVLNRSTKAPQTFVNIGCGYDDHFRTLQARGNTFVNFDIVHPILRDLKQNSGANACVAGDINQLPFKKGSFDCVVSIDVIHHETENLLALLQTFRDLLKPNGILFLEDPNAWGMFQFAKSILLPKPAYRFLRSTYHRLKQSVHRPADYEFPTNAWRVASMLRSLGFGRIEFYPQDAYPCISEGSFRIYNAFKRFDFVRKHHNYHYMLSAERL